MLNLKSDTEHKIEILLLDNQGITVFDFFKKNEIIFCILNGYPVLETLNEMIDNGKVRKIIVKNDFRSLLYFKCEYLFYGDIEMMCGENGMVTWKKENE